MEATRQIVFAMANRVNGQEITPKTIGLHQFNRFNGEVEDFLAGTAQKEKVPVDDIRVSIEDGSYRLVVTLPLAAAALVEPDLRRLERQQLKDVDERRASIVQRWQRQARAEHDFSVSITSSARVIPPITISRETDYYTPDQDEWVEVERCVVGQIMEMGGSATVNVHIALDGGGKLIADSTADYLRDQRKNYLYRRAQLNIAAQQNIRTGALRNIRLLAFVGESPSYDERELEAAIEKGTQAWAGVPNATAWVREQRGDADG